MKKLLAILLLLSTPIFAAQQTWTNINGGDFWAGSSWASGSAPAGGDSCHFPSNNSYTISFTTGGSTNWIAVFNQGSPVVDLKGFTWGITNGPLLVGSNSATSVSLTISNGTMFASNGCFISTNNTLKSLTLGDKGVLSVRGAFAFGGAGLAHSNSLIVLPGASLISTVYGTTSSGISNLIVVSGSGTWTNAGAMTVGTTGPRNTMWVTNGGKVFCTNGTFTLGSGAGASNNVAIISGAGSLLQSSGLITLGGNANATNNVIYVTNGGSLYVVTAAGSSVLGSAGTIYVSDSGSWYTNNNILTTTGGNAVGGSDVICKNGATVYLLDLRLGASVSNDTYQVDGVGSTGQVAALTVGYTSERATFAGISNGGTVFLNSLSVGRTVGSTNTMVIRDSGTFVTNGTPCDVGTNAGGINVLSVSGGATFQFPVLSVGASGYITNNQSIWRLLTATPTVATNAGAASPAGIIFTNAIVQYRSVSGFNPRYTAISNITFQGIQNTLLLGGATNTSPTAPYLVGTNTGDFYQNLVLQGTNPRWTSPATAIMRGGLLQLSNVSVATVYGFVTNSGTFNTLSNVAGIFQSDVYVDSTNNNQPGGVFVVQGAASVICNTNFFIGNSFTNNSVYVTNGGALIVSNLFLLGRTNTCYIGDPSSVLTNVTSAALLSSSTLTCSNNGLFWLSALTNSGTLAFRGVSTGYVNSAFLSTNGTVAFAGYSNLLQCNATVTMSGSERINLSTNSGGILLISNLTRNIGTMTVYGWKGTTNSSGTGDVFKVTIAPSATVLSNINFDGFNPGATNLASGEIVPKALLMTTTNYFRGSGWWWTDN